ncbi:hypothetical protein AAFF_G00359570 [Aldrovandia affinis]|uniref:Uncharacterized protein n=1 Tax=Aldrovandia affinis TaxID=143900 RepID=A0AAD7SK98_9TELE|nr:hypothetical protein AAFF_G00359570 [Aldrovandia affinis]
MLISAPRLSRPEPHSDATGPFAGSGARETGTRAYAKFPLRPRQALDDLDPGKPSGAPKLASRRKQKAPYSFEDAEEVSGASLADGHGITAAAAALRCSAAALTGCHSRVCGV